MPRNGGSACTACWRSALRCSCWAFLAVTVVAQGYSAFWQTRIVLDVNIAADKVDPGRHAPAANRSAPATTRRWCAIPCASCSRRSSSRADRRALNDFLSNAAGDDVKRLVMDEPELVGTTQRVEVLASDRHRHAGQGPHQPRRGGSRPADQGPGDRLVRQARGRGPRRQHASTSISSPPAIRANRSRPGLGGAMMGTFLTIVTRSCCRCRSAWRRRSISRSSRPRTS